MEKNEYVFQSVRKKERVMSSSASGDRRRDAQGDPEASMNQRSGSAPYRSSRSNGSRTLPRLLDIFRPSRSTISPRHTTLR
jgi:hypothetical protein